MRIGDELVCRPERARLVEFLFANPMKCSRSRHSPCIRANRTALMSAGRPNCRKKVARLQDALVDPVTKTEALEDSPVGLQGWLLTLRSYQAVPIHGVPFFRETIPPVHSLSRGRRCGRCRTRRVGGSCRRAGRRLPDMPANRERVASILGVEPSLAVAQAADEGAAR